MLSQHRPFSLQQFTNHQRAMAATIATRSRRLRARMFVLMGFGAFLATFPTLRLVAANQPIELFSPVLLLPHLLPTLAGMFMVYVGLRVGFSDRDPAYALAKTLVEQRLAPLTPMDSEKLAHVLATFPAARRIHEGWVRDDFVVRLRDVDAIAAEIGISAAEILGDDESMERAFDWMDALA